MRRGTASVDVDGRMVDVATAERCKIIPERADAIAAMEARKSDAARYLGALENELRAAIEEAERMESKCIE